MELTCIIDPYQKFQYIIMHIYMLIMLLSLFNSRILHYDYRTLTYIKNKVIHQFDIKSFQDCINAIYEFIEYPFSSISP